MKSPIAAMALAGSLVALTVSAQSPPPPGPQGVAGGTAPAAPAPRSEAEAKQMAASMAGAIPPDQITAPTIALPDDPVEPYLLTKDVGPFMVLAKTFRGPEAERFALALVLELRNEHQLPAYILRLKDYPRNSLVRNLPPTAPGGIDRPRLNPIERVRTIDEAAVLVGNEKSIRAQELLLKQVKKIHPHCLNHLPTILPWREGLGKAIRTTNPYVPAQNLYPGQGDPMIARMNHGPHSLSHCSGRYSLQIAQFGGRSTFLVDGVKNFGDDSLRSSPLATAHEDAERLAAAIAKTNEFKQLGQPIFVYHDKTASRILVGSFNQPNDPKASQLHAEMLKLAVPLMDRANRKRGIDRMIVPATALTDLEIYKVNLQ